MFYIRIKEKGKKETMIIIDWLINYSHIIIFSILAIILALIGFWLGSLVEEEPRDNT